MNHVRCVNRKIKNPPAVRAAGGKGVHAINTRTNDVFIISHTLRIRKSKGVFLMEKKRINTAKWMENQKRWQIKVQKDGERRTFTSSTPGRKGQREANAKADDWLENGVDGRTKIKKLYAKFQEEVKLTTSEGNYANVESIGRVWIIPHIGNKKALALCEQDFQNIINIAYKDGKSKKTLKNIKGVMTNFLKYARKCHATTLRLDDVAIPKKATVSEKKALCPESIRILFGKEASQYWYSYAFRFFVVTGLRRGELIALQKDRDLSGNKLTIRESVNKFSHITEGKTENARRDMILGSLALSIIEDQDTMLKKAGIKSDYIFCNKFGERICPNSLYNRWETFRNLYGIEKVSLHELRHTFTSLCKNMPLEMLKNQLGHSESMDTLGQYGHEIEGEKQAAAMLINEIIENVLKNVG